MPLISVTSRFPPLLVVLPKWMASPLLPAELASRCLAISTRLAACPAPCGIEYEFIEDEDQQAAEARADPFSGGKGGDSSGLCGAEDATSTGYDTSVLGTLFAPGSPSFKISAGSVVEPDALFEQVAGHREQLETLKARCDFFVAKVEGLE